MSIQGNAMDRQPGAPPNDGPDNPHRLAEDFLGFGSARPLRYRHGEFARYTDGSYLPVPEDDMRGELSEFVRAEFVRANRDAMVAWDATGRKGPAPKVRPVTSRLIGDVLQALRGLCLIPTSVAPPAWIDGVAGPDPVGLLAMRNGILDLASLAEGRSDYLLPSSPSFFTPTAAPFEFTPAAPAPSEWMRFLRSIWPDDKESIDALQEWFGYMLLPETRHQKILMLLGPRRSGKGTTTRVLRELIGPENVAGPTLGSLATPFGLSPLLGKSVAIVSDARLSGRSDSAVITERLLSISGEDAITVDRKHRDPVTVKLATRFVILSNELPRLGDTSGALAGRLVLLRMTQSFFGSEDLRLFDRLRAELPGILLWAIEGWCRLRLRGRFVQPASGAELIGEMEDLSSPVGAFVRDRCCVSPEERVDVGELYAAWKAWCELHGRKPGTAVTFGRDLRAAVATVGKARPRIQAGRSQVYTGIRLRVDSDPDPGDEPPDGPGHGGHGDQRVEITNNPLDGPLGHGGHSDPPLHVKRKEEVLDTMVGHYDHHDQSDRDCRTTLFDVDEGRGLPD